MITVDFWTDSCGAPLAHAEHVIEVVSAGLIHHLRCRGRATRLRPIEHEATP